MRDRNLISDISMPAIRTWLKANPKEAAELKVVDLHAKLTH